jgi:nucleoid DNA-binding protein
MNHKNFVAEVSRISNHPTHCAEEILQAAATVLIGETGNGNSVKWEGLGTFKAKFYAAREFFGKLVPDNWKLKMYSEPDTDAAVDELRQAG